MKRRLILLFAVVLAVTSVFTVACRRANGNAVEQQSVSKQIDIYLTNGHEYAPVRVLTDETLRAELERHTGVSVRLHFRDADREGTTVDAERMNGIILTDDLVTMQGLIDNVKISPLAYMPETMSERSYGRYRGAQYGYVFGEAIRPDTPVLVVAVDKLEQAGVKNVPFDTASVRRMLRSLKKHCTEPLAVYGVPTDSSYELLLSLFGLTPRGGREFGADGYDKLSDSAREYLSFVQSLYTEGLLPASMLSSNEYSAGTKLINGVSALMVFDDEEYLRAFIDYAREQNVRIARADIPVPEDYLGSGVNDRLLGLITAGCEDKELATRFLEELDAAAASIDAAEPLKDIETYPLFVRGTSVSASADLPGLEPNVFYLSAKKQLDDQYISVFYSQIATGERTVDAFDTMCVQWKSASASMMNASVTGQDILNYYAEQYRVAKRSAK